LSDAKLKVIAEAICIVLRRKGYFTPRDVYEIVKKHRWFRKKRFFSIVQLIARNHFALSNYVEKRGLRYVCMYETDNQDIVLSVHKKDIEHNIRQGKEFQK